MSDMDTDPPSQREIELEMLLRQRDTQVAELAVSCVYASSITCGRQFNASLIG